MAARRQQVAALLHAGFAQCAIAAQLGVSAAMVSGDCAILREQWRVAAAADYAEVEAALAGVFSDGFFVRHVAKLSKSHMQGEN
jgi:hypothetical protein